MRRTLKRIGLGVLATGVVLALAGWAWVESLRLDTLPVPDPNATAAELAFLAGAVHEQRGRILAVVTSTATFPGEQRRAGYELTELARAYWTFVANGYAVDFASPRGGEPPMVLDSDDVTVADYAFLNDADVRTRLANTLPLREVDAEHYVALYFVGGKGTMFDFTGNPDIARLVAGVDARGGVIGAVCHGPAALIGLRGRDGREWLQGRRVTGFSNAEELFLMEDARTRFPRLLQDALAANGAQYSEAPAYLEHVVADGRLVTGQNPWSTWATAEAMVRALGHEPVPRQRTPEEISVDLLRIHADRGYAAAREALETAEPADRRLLLMHAVVAGMQWRLLDAFQLERLARAAESGDD